MELEFDKFIRKPFRVEAIKITAENIEEIAALIGEVKTKGKDKFIVVDKRVVPNVNRAEIGWYLTQFNFGYRCYHPKAFAQQFMPNSEEWDAWFTEEPEVESTNDGQ